MKKPDHSIQTTSSLRLLAWEITRQCNLSCTHCRAGARAGPYEEELATSECFRLLDHIASFSKPIVILTGGEPLLRPDVFEISRYGTEKGLRMVMASNGTLITHKIAQEMVDSGIKRLSISIDGANSESHDRFRQVDGAFNGAINGIRCAKEVGLDFQINTTVTLDNMDELASIQDLAVNLGAVAHHIFLLVPTGRGRNLVDRVLPAMEYEKVLNWLYEGQGKVPIHIKVTCAPHYYRIMRQRAKEKGETSTHASHGLDAVTRGCLGGIAFCFISHTGDVQPCGYLELNCGNIRHQSFKTIWQESEVFKNLRDLNRYKGKCGRCEYRHICGGCRARAYALTGDYLAEEPFCIYQPSSARKD
ncbi:MAG TPA: heme b synthase [Syntrophaceae bacterium]|nr:heme b synthase [Syntrophaceae bacterium]